GCASVRSKKTIPRVRPGVFDVRASARRPASRLSSVDLPTFERPANAISGAPGGGRPRRSRASARNVAATTSGGRGADSPGIGLRVASVAMRSGLKLVGLTGGIATGKSTVARLIAERGIPIVDADQLAREAVEPGQPALAEIARLWPQVVLPGDGRLDRKRL